MLNLGYRSLFYMYYLFFRIISDFVPSGGSRNVGVEQGRAPRSTTGTGLGALISIPEILIVNHIGHVYSFRVADSATRRRPKKLSRFNAHKALVSTQNPHTCNEALINLRLPQDPKTSLVVSKGWLNINQ